jgi:hypothetical protein
MPIPTRRFCSKMEGDYSLQAAFCHAASQVNPIVQPAGAYQRFSVG